MYAVPAAPGPIIAATCGMTPDMMTCSRKSSPVRANIEPAVSWMRAPAESINHTSGIRSRSASSRMRADLISLTMPIEPAMTVKSYAIRHTRRPSMRPTPVMTPSAGVNFPCICGDCDWWCASNANSSNDPGSNSLSMRSRTVSFPSECWRATLSAPPIPRNFSLRCWRSSTASRSVGPV